MNGSLVASLSGGKDSTALVLWLYEHGIKMADIVYFDTGWEFPEMEPHIAQVEDFIKQKVTVLKPQESLDYLFAGKKRTRGNLKGIVSGYGWPGMKTRWCTRRKINAIAAHVNAMTWRGIPLPVVQCIGFAADESLRIENKGRPPKFQEFAYPLAEIGMTEADALAYCRERGFTWGGLYDIFDRVSCTICPLGGIERARKIYQYFPDIWERMLEMESWLPAGHKGRKYTGRYTVTDLGKKFYSERLHNDRLLSLPDMPDFRAHNGGHRHA